MARPKSDVPTPAESRALLFLHKNGPSTVTDYFKNGGLQDGGRAYTSVMSLLGVLHEKGYATRKLEKRAFRYTAAIPLAELRTRALQQVLENTFGGSLDEMKAVVAKMEAPSKRKK